MTVHPDVLDSERRIRNTEDQGGRVQVRLSQEGWSQPDTRSATSPDTRLAARPETFALYSVELTSHAVPRESVPGEKLLELAEKRMNPQAASRFSKDLADLEARCSSGAISQKELNETITQIAMLLDPALKGAVSNHERQILAQQVMHQAAHPEAVAQGGHDTCNVSTIESRIYARYPSNAAKLVTDVSLHGSFRFADGRTIKFDGALAGSLHPLDEAQTHPPLDGKRSYASQIFQVTAVNAKYLDESAKYGREGTLRYEQHAPSRTNPNGEQVVWYPKDPPSRIVGDSPGVTLQDMHKISNQITGKNEIGFTIERISSVKSPLSVGVDSRERLQQLLAKIDDQKAFPVIMMVNTNNEPFHHDSGADMSVQAGGFHVITITGYDKKTGLISLRNEWGKQANHSGDDALSAKMLYLSTIDPFDATMARSVKSRVINDRRDGHVDAMFELSAFHIRYFSGEFADARPVFIQELCKTLDSVGNKWQDKSLSEHERKECMLLLTDAIRLTNSDDAAAIKRSPGWQKLKKDYIASLKPDSPDPIYGYVTGYLR